MNWKLFNSLFFGKINNKNNKKELNNKNNIYNKIKL